MRKPVRYILSLTVAAFYLGVAGAAVSPYYSAVTDFIRHTAASFTTSHKASPSTAPGTLAAASGGHTSSDGLHRSYNPTGGSTVAATPTATQPAASPTPNALQRRELIVQRLAAKAKVPRHRVNILVLGSDNDAKNAPGATPPTQVMMVVSIDPLSQTITLFSISRDSWVHIPGYGYNTGPDGTVGWNKIAVASGFGFNSTACTIETNFHIPIDHWMWVGLQGFIKVIDTLNGVTVDVTNPVLDDEYPDDLNPNNPFAYRRIYIPPGPQHLNGDTALHFVRSRHGDLQSDFSRSAHQQIVITQLRHALANQDMASLVALVPSLVQDLKDEVKTDISFDLPTAAYYWSLLRSAAHYKITQVVLSPPYSQQVQIPDQDPTLEQLNGGKPFTQDAVQLNWNLVWSLVQNTFGALDFSRPHCA